MYSGKQLSLYSAKTCEALVRKQSYYLLTVAASTIWACDADANFRTLQFPGSINTIVTGTSGGKFVGEYWNSSTAFKHGFIFDGSMYTTLDFPGSITTVVSDIEGNRITGSYRDASQVYKGFVYADGDFDTVHPPFTSSLFLNGSEALGISGSTIVGQYVTDAAERRGYVYDGATYTPFDPPNGPGNNAADDVEVDQVVGYYLTAGDFHGYYYDGISFIEIDHPAATGNGTLVTGISGDRIVGNYYDATLRSKGFILQDNVFATFVVPATLGQATSISGISGNIIVGGYLDSSNNYHGFVAVVPESTSYKIFICGLFMVAQMRPIGRRAPR
jgi:hypothetical protein